MSIVALIDIGTASVVVGLSKIRVDGDCFIIIRDGLSIVALSGIGIASVVVDINIIRI